MSPPDAKNARIFVAIDIGSNATKIKRWRLDKTKDPAPIDFERHPLRLGAGAFDTGEIPEPMIARLIGLLKTIREDNDSSIPAAIRAVATSAMRDAKNGAEIRKRARGQAGVEIEILTGEQEAALMALGALGDRKAGEACMLLDIGGGSTELIVASGKRVQRALSMPLGAVRLRADFFVDAPIPSLAQRRAAEAKIESVLNAELSGIVLPEAPHAIGLAGTITTLHKMLAHSNEPLRQAAKFSLEAIAALSEELSALTAREIEARYPIEHDRAEVIFAGSLILIAILRRLKIKTLNVAFSGVADGLLQEYLNTCPLL